MAIQGNKREHKEYQKVVGLFEGRVLAFNPTREELEELLGTEIEKDPEYFTPDYEMKDEDGNVTDVVKKLTVSVWVQQVKMVRNTNGELEDDGSGLKFNIRFNLLDANRKDKAGEKYQYMNKHGLSTWPKKGSTSADDIQDWFKEIGGVRVAKIGEANLYDFLRSWLLIDFKNDPEAELALDWSRLMRNDLRELKDALNSDLAGTVLCLATVRTADGDNGPVEYQSVYNGAFLPGSYIRAFRAKGRKAPKALEKFIKETTDPEYGCKDHFVMEELKDYDPSLNEAASDDVHREAATSGAAANTDEDTTY
jgi:hypothetical protein